MIINKPLTRREIQKKLGISYVTFFNYLKSGQIKIVTPQTNAQYVVIGDIKRQRRKIRARSPWKNINYE